MPLTASATKRARQNAVRHARLKPYMTRMKTMMKKLAEAAKAGKKDEAKKLLADAYKAIDIAAKKRLIHRRNADRKKASMSRMVNDKK